MSISYYVTGGGELLSAHLTAEETEAQRGSVMCSGAWLAGDGAESSIGLFYSLPTAVLGGCDEPWTQQPATETDPADIRQKESLGKGRKLENSAPVLTTA